MAVCGFYIPSLLCFKIYRFEFEIIHYQQRQMQINAKTESENEKASNLYFSPISGRKSKNTRFLSDK